MIMSHLLLMTVFTNGIQALQHKLKKSVEHKGDYVEKINLICSNFMIVFCSAYELFSQPSCVCVYIYIYIYIHTYTQGQSKSSKSLPERRAKLNILTVKTYYCFL